MCAERDVKRERAYDNESLTFCSEPAQQLAAGQTHYPGGRSSATQSNLASISSTPARLRPILRAPAMVLPPPQPQLQQQQQQPQPRLVANDIASTSTVRPNKHDRTPTVSSLCFLGFLVCHFIHLKSNTISPAMVLPPPQLHLLQPTPLLVPMTFRGAPQYT